MFHTEQTSTRINDISITQSNQLYELTLSTTVQHSNNKECNVIAFITRHKVYSIQRRGWYSLVVTQPSTSHQLLCVQVYVCACNCFVWYLL